MKIGTMVRGNGGKAPRRLKALLSGGFESFQLHWWAGIGDERLAETAYAVQTILAEYVDSREKPAISSLGLYANPLRTDAEGEEARRSLGQLIRHARHFGCDLVGIFTGRLPGTPWEESLTVFRKIIGDFCLEAADHGVRLAMENCPMDGSDESGDWNLAYKPSAWTRLFEALPSAAVENLGLEWEPAHQILQGLNPMEQIEDWAHLFYHIHGKDARIERDGSRRQTLPGNGDTDWFEVIRQLRTTGYTGSIDIEGYSDEEWSGEREIPGQVRSASYLKKCRDGLEHGPSWSQGDTRS
jgi:sugar phosphate isomerase/epimerase